jgi:phosphotransferase system enzyme I (PtsP)
MARHGHRQPKRVMLGAMIEVPALLFQLDGLVKVADFVSVGTNDLLQFMTASDRGNVRVAQRFDPLSRSFLRALKSIADVCGPQMPVTLCGELAGSPLAAMALVGLGFRSLSMSPASIGPVKAMVLALKASDIRDELGALLDGGSAETFRPALTEFAKAAGIPH